MLYFGAFKDEIVPYFVNADFENSLIVKSQSWLLQSREFVDKKHMQMISYHFV